MLVPIFAVFSPFIYFSIDNCCSIMLLNLSCSVFEIVSQNVRLNFLNNEEFLIIFYV